MTKQMPSIARITRPKLSGIAGRERLFRQIEKGKNKPVTWVAAQAGAGKTTLAASYVDSRKLPCVWYQMDAGDSDAASFFYYLGMAAKKAAPRYRNALPLLTPEYLQNIPVFTRRYFEELFRRLKPSSVVVFDNYQDVPDSSGFHEMIAQALETVPEGIRVIILSRNVPPPQLARLRANNRLHLIGWDDVRFTREESAELLNKQGHGRADKNTVARLHEKTEGWAAGLVLMAGRKSDAFDEKSFGGIEPAKVFDYFADEIFSRTDEAMQELLLKTAFLHRINPGDAEELTGNTQATMLLERLSKNHYFTQKYDRAYQYHPLFREFLLDRAHSSFDADGTLSIKRKAAKLLQTTGRSEDAAVLHIDAGEWPALIHLILLDAQTLILQGRSKTVEQWINAVPEDMRMANAWLLYWHAICRMPFDPRQSRDLLEKAFGLFKTSNDLSGVFLSWASLIDTFSYEWGKFHPVDEWIARAEELLSQYPQFPSPEVEARVAAGMFNALTWRRPLHPDLPAWASKVMQIVLHNPSSQLRMTLGNNLLFYYLWFGDSAKADVIINALKPLCTASGNDPLTQVMWYLMEAMYAWLMNDPATCYRAVAEGRHIADRTGVHLLDEIILSMGCECSMSIGDRDKAAAYLSEIASLHITRILDRVQFQHLCASLAWANGDWQKAREHGETALTLIEETGHYLGKPVMEEAHAVALFDMGLKTEANRYHDRALESGKGIKRVEFTCKLQKARLAFESGAEEEAVLFLRDAMSLGAQNGYVNFIRWSSDVMSRLCAKALEYGIEAKYARKLITVRKLMPPENMADPGVWPWPIRINTLGEIEVRKDDKPVRFAGKKKQLELLKLMIALGGSSIREEQVTDLLWPDAEGDDAHNSFKMTLSRLRAAIGNESILHEEGLYYLNRQIVSVDAWDFERLCETASRFWRQDNEPKSRTGEAAHLTNKALELYGGHFLPDDDSTWTVSMRERLKSYFLRLTISSGRYYEDKGKWNTAAAYYEKALETDPLREEFYQRLMICNLKLGRRAEAISAYNRCRSELSTLGIEPSAQTAQIYETAK